MNIETWISDDNKSNPIPSPLPDEMKNREILTTGYAGCFNMPGYPTAKIEAIIEGKIKFSIQHPLIWGWRWAYCDGLFLVLICREFVDKFGIFFEKGTVEVLPGSNPSWRREWSGYYDSQFSDTRAFPDQMMFFYTSPYPLNEVGYSASKDVGTKEWKIIPAQRSPILSEDGAYIALKNYTSIELGAENLFPQRSGIVVPPQTTTYGSFYERFPPANGELNRVDLGFNRAGFAGNRLFLDYDWNNLAWGPRDFDLIRIIEKGKKHRTSPYHADFVEIAIDILNKPCPIKIMVDPTLSQSGEDYFCLDYQDYDGLINRFNNIEQKLDQLPP